MSCFWTVSPLLVITVSSLQMSSVSCSHFVPLQQIVTDLGVTSWMSSFHKSLKVSEYVSVFVFYFNLQLRCAYLKMQFFYLMVKCIKILFLALLKKYHQKPPSFFSILQQTSQISPSCSPDWNHLFSSLVQLCPGFTPTSPTGNSSSA